MEDIMEGVWEELEEKSLVIRPKYFLYVDDLYKEQIKYHQSKIKSEL